MYSNFRSVKILKTWSWIRQTIYFSLQTFTAFSANQAIEIIYHSKTFIQAKKFIKFVEWLQLQNIWTPYSSGRI